MQHTEQWDFIAQMITRCGERSESQLKVNINYLESKPLTRFDHDALEVRKVFLDNLDQYQANRLINSTATMIIKASAVFKHSTEQKKVIRRIQSIRQYLVDKFYKHQPTALV